jgi:hypothetical protein
MQERARGVNGMSVDLGWRPVNHGAAVITDDID